METIELTGKVVRIKESKELHKDVSWVIIKQEDPTGRANFLQLQNPYNRQGNHPILLNERYCFCCFIEGRLLVNTFFQQSMVEQTINILGFNLLKEASFCEASEQPLSSEILNDFVGL